jgi:hypothetical protein
VDLVTTHRVFGPEEANLQSGTGRATLADAGLGLGRLYLINGFEARGIMTVRKHQNLREGVIALVVLIVVFIVVYALQLR